MIQLHAGYFIEELLPFLLNEADDNVEEAQKKVLALLRQLSYFEVDSSIPLEGHSTEPNSLVAVAGNLIGRGMPTRAPLSLAAHLLEHVWPGQSVETTDLGSIRYDLKGVEADWGQLLWRALHVIEPRLGDTPSRRQEL